MSKKKVKISVSKETKNGTIIVKKNVPVSDIERLENRNDLIKQTIIKKEKTAAEIAAERIRNMPVDSLYVEVEDLPIPAHMGLLMKECPRSGLTLDSGVIIPETLAANVAPYNEGICYAIGPKCSEFMRLGLRYQFSSYVDTYFWHKGVKYFKLDETLVHYIVPDPRTLVFNGNRTEKQVRQIEGLDKQNKRNIVLYNHEQNEKDIQSELLKKLKHKGRA